MTERTRKLVKCHWCGKRLPEPHYDVVIYAELNPNEDVPVCVSDLRLHHRNKATRMEKV